MTAKCPGGQEWVGVRYAWRESPCAFEECPVYASNLPGPPFLKIGLQNETAVDDTCMQPTTTVMITTGDSHQTSAGSENGKSDGTPKHGDNSMVLVYQNAAPPLVYCFNLLQALVIALFVYAI